MNKLTLTVCLLVALCSGCSGNGNDAASAPQPTPAPQPVIDPNLSVPVRTAFANVVQNGFNQSFTISGSVDNSTPSNPAPPTRVTGNGRFVLGAGVPVTLCTFPVLQATQTTTGTTIANGISTPFASTGTIYYRSDNTIVATDSEDGFFLFTPVAYPETVKAGDTGPVGDGTQFNRDCTQTFFATKITGSYFVESDSATSLLVTFIAIQKDAGGGETQTTTIYRITTSGEITLKSITAARTFLASTYKTIIFTF